MDRSNLLPGLQKAVQLLQSEIASVVLDTVPFPIGSYAVVDGIMGVVDAYGSEDRELRRINDRWFPARALQTPEQFARAGGYEVEFDGAGDSFTWTLGDEFEQDFVDAADAWQAAAQHLLDNPPAPVPLTLNERLQRIAERIKSLSDDNSPASERLKAMEDELGFSAGDNLAQRLQAVEKYVGL